MKTLWNYLPSELRQSKSLASVKCLLESFLFMQTLGNICFHLNCFESYLTHPLYFIAVICLVWFSSFSLSTLVIEVVRK